MLLPPSVPTLSSPVGVPPNPTGPKSVRTRDPEPRFPPGLTAPPFALERPGAGQLLIMAGERGDQLGRAATTAKQLTHMRLGAAQGLQRRHALQRLPSGDVEDHRVPRGRRAGFRGLPQAAPPEEGPGVLGRVLDRALDG